tara:strand:+ start:107 stop:568 length:462 start_codon:yes stop_codon:yes gene_type:complete
MPKQIYAWSKVRPGDIISFRYKGKKGSGHLTTILVLNPKLRLQKSEGAKFYLIGLKLETKGTIPVIKDKNQLVEMLSEIGVIEVVDAKNEIYRVVIAGQVRVGFKQANYAAIQRFVKRHKNYRTYRYEEATNSQVFLEPIALPKVLAEALIET